MLTEDINVGRSYRRGIGVDMYFFRYLLFMVLASMTVSVDRVFFVFVSHVPVAATY